MAGGSSAGRHAIRDACVARLELRSIQSSRERTRQGAAALLPDDRKSLYEAARMGRPGGKPPRAP
jgi:hypothetical protein